MKTVVLLFLTAFALVTSARASGPTTTEITTTDQGVTYTLHDYDWRVEKERQSPEEIEAREEVEAAGGRISFSS